MSKQYAVIGLGKFGFAVATTLAQAGKEVLAVDKDPELVQEIADLVTYAARADITDSRVFASLGISNMDVVIVGISENMESSILATLQAKDSGFRRQILLILYFEKIENLYSKQRKHLRTVLSQMTYFYVKESKEYGHKEV